MIFAKKNPERGSAFILALMVVAAAGLLVVPVIYLATTGLRSTNLAQQRFLERYAVDAGVENGIWIIENSPPAVVGASGSESYTSTFNKLLTDIDIELVALPPSDPTPQPRETVNNPSGKNVTVYKSVNPQYVAACSGVGCSWNGTYTMFMENFGNSFRPVRQFGDCLPAGFTFVAYGSPIVEVRNVKNLIWVNSGDLVTDAEMNAAQQPYINDGSEPVCNGGQQVKWVFPSPGVAIRDDEDNKIVNVVSFKFDATGTVGMPNDHFNNGWVELVGKGQVESGPTSPVHVLPPTYDITSETGGTKVGARAAVYDFPGNIKESFILSWQVE